MTNIFDLVNCCKVPEEESSGDEVEDRSAVGLSPPAKAAYDVLRRHHNHQHHKAWNVTSGKLIGDLHQTPLTGWGWESDPKDGHDDWFPEKMKEILERTEIWAGEYMVVTIRYHTLCTSVCWCSLVAS
jgi:hypothetical protein